MATSKLTYYSPLGVSGQSGHGSPLLFPQCIHPISGHVVRLTQCSTLPLQQNGTFEVEFQNDQPRVLFVTENRNPAPPPTGFTALEPVSYQVSLIGGTAGLTLQKIDYILNANSKWLSSLSESQHTKLTFRSFLGQLDISKGQIGRLCPESNAFVIGSEVCELEFEEEEKELTLTVNNMIGEWAIFVAQAA